MKYAIDRVVAALMTLVLLPVFAILVIAVRLSSPGPIFFRQRRVGRDGRPFDLLKFRSMRPPRDGADAGPIALAPGTAPGGVEGEDRRTAIGKLMRRTSLDELPQLFNVLKGDMSVVGPRPERPEFVELFEQSINRYEDRHRVKAGHHRLGPGARPPRQDVAGGQDRVGQLLHRELVALARPEDPDHDDRRRLPRRGVTARRRRAATSR